MKGGTNFLGELIMYYSETTKLKIWLEKTVDAWANEGGN